MAGYFGTETQRRLQAAAETRAPFVAATPGARQTGRTMGCDDPERFGWMQIDAFLAEDGVFGFRLLAADRVDDLQARIAERGCRLDTWNVFLADRASALAASAAVPSRRFPTISRTCRCPATPKATPSAASRR